MPCSRPGRSPTFTGLPAVADDSGLCVDALNGMPGVLSARWAGRHGDDEANLRLVLGQLADVPDERRGAHFACTAALVLPVGPGARLTEGIVHGPADRRAARRRTASATTPSSCRTAAELTTAEMSADDKDRISHRGKALRAIAPVIAAMVVVG